MRTRLALLAAIAAALLTGLAVLAFWPTRDAAQECFDRIEVGMSMTDAEAVLGSYGFTYDVTGRSGGMAWKCFEHKVEGATVCIGGDFWAKGPVQSKTLQKRESDETPLARLGRA